MAQDECLVAPGPWYRWHSRGYLPHCDADGVVQTVTFRLADAIPQAVLERLVAQAGAADLPGTAELHSAIRSATAGLHSAPPGPAAGTAELHSAQPDAQVLRLQAARQARLRRALEKYLDRGAGCCLLGQPACGSIVEQSLLHFDGERYRLLAWCVMPNHVHVVALMLGDARVGHVVQSWKRHTAREIKALLANAASAPEIVRPGQTFWQPDY